MSVPPKFAAQLLTLSSTSASASAAAHTVPHTLEFYLDYVCPFSAKQFRTLHSHIIPLIKQKYSDPGVRVIFRHQVQPWHPSSTLTHEAGLAVLKTTNARGPEAFWDFSRLLFEQQTDFFDVNVVDEPRNKTYERLAKLAGQVDGVDESKILSLLKVSNRPGEGGALNTGNQVTDDLKWLIKQARQTGVHVSPTVLFNGVPEGAISSGWTVDQWTEWLEKNVKS